MDIHTWFNLTYANYLVVPRSVLQSMPEDWQHRFVACLREMEDAFGHLDWPVYDVRTLAREPEVIGHEECFSCGGNGWIGDPELTCAECDGEGEVEIDHRYETPEEVGFRLDPIPHYNRGRTKLEPRT